MPAQASSGCAARPRALRYFGPSHRLARRAGALCASHVVGAAVAGRSVCGGCWERVVRDDERLLMDPSFDADALPVGERTRPRSLVAVTCWPRWRCGCAAGTAAACGR
jgi:hypothetical protein